jgi:hypothetical protein
VGAADDRSDTVRTAQSRDPISPATSLLRAWGRSHSKVQRTRR